MDTTHDELGKKNEWRKETETDRQTERHIRRPTVEQTALTDIHRHYTVLTLVTV